MVIILFIMIKPIVPTKEEIPLEEQVLIKLEWEDTEDVDLDLWLADPLGNIVGFKNLHAGSITLERDDLGFKNEYGWIDGKISKIYDNTEVIRIKDVMDGNYDISVQFYSARGWKEKTKLGKEVPSDIEFKVTIYFAAQHTPVAISYGRVVPNQEVGVISLQFFEKRLIHTEPSNRLIALKGYDN